MIFLIRKFCNDDLDKIMKIWLESNIDAHYFIDKSYWINNFDNVKQMILNSDIFVYIKDDEIVAFVGLIDKYIAGLFVQKNFRNSLIGTKLLEYLRLKYNVLTLNVYCKNKSAISFYKKQKFEIVEQLINIETNEKEYVMRYKNN